MFLFSLLFILTLLEYFIGFILMILIIFQRHDNGGAFDKSSIHAQIQGQSTTTADMRTQTLSTIIIWLVCIILVSLICKKIYF